LHPATSKDEQEMNAAFRLGSAPLCQCALNNNKTPRNIAQTGSTRNRKERHKMAHSKIFLAATLTVGLTAASMAALAPHNTSSPAAVLTSDVSQRMAVVHKLPENPFKREVVEDRCGSYKCQEI
jgi:hypothetical protein